MNSNNRLSLYIATVSFSLTTVLLMTLLLGPDDFIVSQTYATLISQGESNNTIGNKTISHDPKSTVAAMVTAFGEPFYELTDAVDTGKEVVSLDPQQTKDSYIAQGYMVGIGNVTEHGTYVSTYSSPSISSTGKGMIVKGDNVATFTATDTGEYDNEGNLFLKGSMYFNSDSEDMESIDGKVGLYLYWKGNNGTDWTKTWLWE
jgi:hypothetical protein